MIIATVTVLPDRAERMTAELVMLGVHPAFAERAVAAALGCRSCFEGWHHVRAITGLGPYQVTLFLRKHGVLKVRAAVKR